MKEEDLVRSLKRINNVLKSADIDYWLDAGTLLGAVRENRFLPWDYDIDIGAWQKDVSDILKATSKLEKEGFEVIYFTLDKCIKILDNNSEIDINLYEQKEKMANRIWLVNNKKGEILDYLRWVLSTKRPELKRSKVPKTLTKILHFLTKILSDKHKEGLKNKILEKYKKSGCRIVKVSIPSSYFSDFSDFDFYDISVRVTKDPERYLEFRYGKDWRTPKKNYVYYKDDKSIVKKGK